MSERKKEEEQNAAVRSDPLPFVMYRFELIYWISLLRNRNIQPAADVFKKCLILTIKIAALLSPGHESLICVSD